MNVITLQRMWLDKYPNLQYSMHLTNYWRTALLGIRVIQPLWRASSSLPISRHSSPQIAAGNQQGPCVSISSTARGWARTYDRMKWTRRQDTSTPRNNAWKIASIAFLFHLTICKRIMSIALWGDFRLGTKVIWYFANDILWLNSYSSH